MSPRRSCISEKDRRSASVSMASKQAAKNSSEYLRCLIDIRRSWRPTESSGLSSAATCAYTSSIRTAITLLALAAKSSEQSSPGTFHILATVSRSFPHEGEKPRPVVFGSEPFEQLEHRHSGALALGSRAPDEQVDA